MEIYKIGKVVSVGKSYIILESNFSGYTLNVARPDAFEKDKNRKVFIYSHKNDYSEATYGFETFTERVLFEDLIALNGIGPKTALNLLKEGVDQIVNYIANGEVDKISKYPSLGLKSAGQIVLELSEKYKNFANKRDGGTAGAMKYSLIDVKDSLKTLGFNVKQIDYAASKIRLSNSLEEMVENSIRLIADAKFA